MRKFLVIAVLIIFLSSVHAQELRDKLEKNYLSIGSSTGAASIIHLDMNADGMLDAVGIMDDYGGRVLTAGFSGSQMWSLLIQRGTSDGAIAAADFKGSGYLSDVVSGSKDVLAIDGTSGIVLWKFTPSSSVYSLAAVDFNGDGKLNEIVVGGWGIVYAMSSSGSVLWTYILNENERNAQSLAGVDLNGDGLPEAVAVGANKRVLLLDSKGNLLWSADTPGLVHSIIAADLDSKGYLDTVVAGSPGGNRDKGEVTAYYSNGNLRWSNELYLTEGKKVKLYAMDAESKGNLNYVLAVRDFASLLYPNGMVRWNYPDAKSAAPIDLNADGKFEGVVIGGSSALYFINPNGQQAGYYVETYDGNNRNITPYNITGADVIISADLDGDSFLDDAIGISSYTIFGVKHTPAAIARPTKVMVVANLIDYALAVDFFEFLRNSGVEAIHVLPQNFNQYKNEKNIVILGGHKAPDGTGDIVKTILPPPSQLQLEVKGAQKMFAIGAVWGANQKVVVLAGYNREDTRWAHVKYRANVF